VNIEVSINNLLKLKQIGFIVKLVAIFYDTLYFLLTNPVNAIPVIRAESNKIVNRFGSIPENISGKDRNPQCSVQKH